MANTRSIKREIAKQANLGFAASSQASNLNGTTYFVRSTTGSSGYDGLDATHPKATIAQVLALSGLVAGDTLILLADHVETVSSPTALAISVAGLSFLGKGIGSRRPTITLDTGADTTIAVSAANIYWENIVFSANFADIVSLFTLTTATNMTCKNCEAVETAVNMNFLHIVDLATTANAADGLTFDNFFWNEPDAATLAFALIDGNIDRLKIVDCQMYTGNATQDTPFLLSCGSKVLTGVRILRNKMQMVGHASTTTGLMIVNSSTTSNGFVCDNALKHLVTSGDIICNTGTKIFFDNNKLSGVADKSGYLLPAADS